MNRFYNNKWLAGSILFFLLLFGALDSMAAECQVLLNGQTTGIETVFINDQVYVPVQRLTGILGAESVFDDTQNTINIITLNNEVIPQIIKSVSPSVVGVIGSLKEDAEYSSKYQDNIAHGTGVVIKSNGQILTNAHVVKDMERIVVVLSDGSGYEAALLYMDEETDLALISIEKDGLTAAKFGKQEDIITGSTVIAIGTPVSFSLRNSASLGIVSGLNRLVDSAYLLIQTDAAINPGNSGGPLVNLQGEIIGINSSKYAGFGIEGLGFSIPVNTITYVIDQFHKYGQVKRPTLGVIFEEDWAARVGLPSAAGLSIGRVDKNEVLEAGDVLLGINGTKVNTIVDFNEEMKKYLPGQVVKLKIKRNNVIQYMDCVLGQKCVQK